MKNVTRCRYLMCRCGAVYNKEKILSGWRNALFLEAGDATVVPMGTRTCAGCGNVMEVSDIYSGKYDLPREHWTKVSGPVEL